MTRVIRAGALQLLAHDRQDFERLEAGLLAKVESACDGVDLLVVPEGTMPAYVLGTEPLDGEKIEQTIEALARIAARTQTVIVAGVALRAGEHAVNAALVVDRDGTVAGRAEKIFLWHFDRKWFAPGERIAPVKTSIGSIGALICADGRMPQIAAALSDAGAEILTMPTAWVTSGRDPANLENVQADLLARVRAYENGVSFVAANKAGIELGMVAYCGKSQIVDAQGTLLACASETNEERIVAPVELRAAVPQRSVRRPIPTRAAPAVDTTRVAIGFELPGDIERRLGILDADFAIAPGARDRAASLDAAIPTVLASADEIFDPHFLVNYRRAGYRVAIVEGAAQNPQWLGTIARARALELRMYLIVFDAHSQRAYAVDPDGSVIAGTFGDFRIASFAVDVRRTQATGVAPGTDVAEGLDRVSALVRDEART